MNKKRECRVCGATRNRNGRLFRDVLAVRNHESFCKVSSNDIGPFPLTDMIMGDDEPDGAYFAMAFEMGEWF